MNIKRIGVDFPFPPSRAQALCANDESLAGCDVALSRRTVLGGLCGSAFAASAFASTLLLSATAQALQPSNSVFAGQPRVLLSRLQSQAFVQWLVLLIEAQLRSPTPRWKQRDCVGLVRFAAAEALRSHDEKWARANGLRPPFPPDLVLTDAQKKLRHSWKQADGSRSAYVSAIDLIQHNSKLVGRDFHAAQAGDMLFYDQGDDQHVMVWLGRTIAYHTGQTAQERAGEDTGMRSVRLQDMMRWRDTRWRPTPDNPNFAGVYRLFFVQGIG